MDAQEPIPGFNPNAGAPIDPKTAEQWTANYRNEPLTDAENNGRKRINAYYFGNELLDKIQQQAGCVGLRFYMGLEKGKGASGQNKEEYQIVVVGVDENGYDIVPRTQKDGTVLSDDGIVGDNAQKCPVVCDPTSPLG